jgi:glycosyltransferase involved in cell wall biosynthesis
MNKSAVLYDYMQVKGGAESVTLTLCNEIPDMDLVTAFMSPEAFPKGPIVEERIKTLISPTTRPGLQVLKSALAFEHKTKFLRDYETLIFSGSVAPLAVKYSRAEKNIYYCHTPPRFVYDLRDYYLDAATLLQRPALKALIAYLQPRYEDAIGRMDKVFANSKNVQDRLQRFLGVDSEVLYPPVDTDRFKWLGEGNYFLSTARLEPLKRVDLIVKAFKQLPDQKLIVTSGGSQLEPLKKLAVDAPNIEFTGWVTEERLAELIGHCRATIYIPKNEDFGMSPAESIAAGKPVIAVDEGGVCETVTDGISGILMDSIGFGVTSIVSTISSLSRDFTVVNEELDYCNFGSKVQFVRQLLHNR